MQELIAACVEDFGAEPKRRGVAAEWPSDYAGVVKPSRKINFDRWVNTSHQPLLTDVPFLLVGCVNHKNYRGYWLCLRSHVKRIKCGAPMDQYFDSRKHSFAHMIAPASIRKICIGK